MAGEFRFSFGPWNIHEGADPFGPTVRKGIAFAKKVKLYKKLGFDGVQFHDDDAVPDLDSPDLQADRPAGQSRPARCSRARAWWPSSSPRGCGRTR